MTIVIMDLPLNSKAKLKGASVMLSPQTGSSSTDTRSLANKTQNRPRHRKTRTGCFNCKRRRIKVNFGMYYIEI